MLELKQINQNNENTAKIAEEEIINVFKKIDEVYLPKIEDLNKNMVDFRGQLENLTTKLIDEICSYDVIPFEKVELDLQTALENYCKILFEFHYRITCRLKYIQNICKDEVTNAYSRGMTMESAYKKYVQDRLDKKGDFLALSKNTQK